MSEENVIKHEGVTLFRKTVVGYIDSTMALITVGSLQEDWAEVLRQHNERNAELSDALSMLISEITVEGFESFGHMGMAVAIAKASLGGSKG